jgi:hypothetical protein
MWSHEVNQEQPYTLLRNIGRPALMSTLMSMPLPVIPTHAERPSTTFALAEFVPPSQSRVLGLALVGELDVHAYSLLVESARAAYGRGWRCLLLDLSRTTAIELSGFLALLNVARLFAGQPMLDPDEGWAALRAPLAMMTAALGSHVKLLAPSPQARAALDRAPFCAALGCYANVERALVAFA